MKERGGWSGVIFPEGDKRFRFSVLVYKNKKRFMEAVVYHGTDTPLADENTLAFFVPATMKVRGKKTNDIGLLVFSEPNLKRKDQRECTIAHECLHATLHYLRYTGYLKRVLRNVQGEKGSKTQRTAEEMFCHILDNLVRQVFQLLKIAKKREARR